MRAFLRPSFAKYKKWTNRMAANGISTLANKASRKAAKIALAQAKRQMSGTIGFRSYNVYVGTVSPIIGRPWDISGGVVLDTIDGSTTNTSYTNSVDGGNSTASFTGIIDGGNSLG